MEIRPTTRGRQDLLGNYLGFAGEVADERHYTIACSLNNAAFTPSSA
jgi:hypothetical protein